MDVLVLINPDSGLGNSFNTVGRALVSHWEDQGIDLKVQFNVSKEDGRRKAEKAVNDGVDLLLVAGGDGAVNTVGEVLVGTDTVLGVIPSGSGNGFARHFDIPLDIGAAVASLRRGHVRDIDVGYANGRPFFVTCSLAWDGALVPVFERFPFRGVLPYVFAAVYEFFEYEPRPFEVIVDGGTPEIVDDLFLCTIANLTQYGGGAIIAPEAHADDGRLQLVTARRNDLPKLLPMIGRVFNGTLDSLSHVSTRSFKTLTIDRGRGGPIQLDGEVVEAGAKVEFRVQSRGLKVLVPE